MPDDVRKPFQSGREILSRYVPAYTDATDDGNEQGWEQRLRAARAVRTNQSLSAFEKEIDEMEKALLVVEKT
jgi:hypothetical protein